MTETELVDHIIALGRQNTHCRRIRLGNVEVEFHEPKAEAPEKESALMDVTKLKLPPEAAPPDGDALLYYSTPFGPELENEKQGA